jgi:hypothetical protein
MERCTRSHPPRHSSQVGAVCGKAARTVLCGGRSAMVVPTATTEITYQSIAQAQMQTSEMWPRIRSSVLSVRGF